MTSFERTGGSRLETPIPIAEQRWPEGTAPLVSIVCPTFNHSRFIRDCLDGFLMQATSFPVEILVHDDASTDGTAEIVREYCERYPRVIRAIFQAENQYSKGVKVTSVVVRMARGEFIATCEGDDHWIAPTKLERQVALFERHPDCLLCGGRVFVQRDGASTPYTIEPRVPPEELATIGPTAILRGEWYLKTLSRVCTRRVWNDYLDVVGRDGPACDYLFVLYCISRAQSESSRFYCLDEVVAVYREHPGGVWFSKTEEMRWRANLRVLVFALSHFHFVDGEDLLREQLIRICGHLDLSSTGLAVVDELLANRRHAARRSQLRRSLSRLRALFQ